jgi:ribosomal 50S subunit-recycling heat shock protein
MCYNSLLRYIGNSFFLNGNARYKRKEVDMRLDKFLKVSRLIKRRTVANDACDAGRVMINDKPAKAATNVKVGDIIEIGFGGKAVKVEVTSIADTTKKDEAKELYKYI